MISRISSFVSRTMLVFAAALALLLSFVVCVDVVGRLVFDSPLRGTLELVSSAVVIICFMQLPFSIRSGGMINVDFLVEHLPPNARAGLVAVGAMLGALFFGFVLWGGLDPLSHAWMAGEYEGEGALHVPVWPARLTIVVGTGLAALNYVLMALDSVVMMWGSRSSSDEPMT